MTSFLIWSTNCACVDCISQDRPTSLIPNLQSLPVDWNGLRLDFDGECMCVCVFVEVSVLLCNMWLFFFVVTHGVEFETRQTICGLHSHCWLRYQFCSNLFS